MNILPLAAGTGFILIFSWFLSVKHKRFHGIPRFFSFESIFILTNLNAHVWFKDPFSLNQILSWIFLLFSFYPVIAGYYLLNKKGNPASSNFENTSSLVKTGIYRFIRHPLYLSLFILGTGIVLKDPGPLQLALGAINLIAVVLTSKVEENEMVMKFGDEYKKYMTETKMFIPYVL